MTVEETRYVVKVPLKGGSDWFELCECEAPAAAVLVVDSLLRTGTGGPSPIQVERVTRFVDPK